MSIIYIHIQ